MDNQERYQQVLGEWGGLADSGGDMTAWWWALTDDERMIIEISVLRLKAHIACFEEMKKYGKPNVSVSDLTSAMILYVARKEGCSLKQAEEILRRGEL